MNLSVLLQFFDRWALVVLIYLLPYQSRIIFSQGFLAGTPSEYGTWALLATEVLLVAAVAVRLVRRRFFNHPALIVFGFLVAVSVVSFLVADHMRPAAVALVHLFEGFGIFFLVLTHERPREARIAFVVSMALQAAIALSQVVLQHVHPNTLLGLSEHDPSIPGTSVVETGSMRWLRAYGLFPHPNILGAGLALAILLASTPSTPLFTKEGARGRWVWVACIVALLSIALFFSFSRLAWAALIFGLFGHAWQHRKSAGWFKIPAIVMAVFVLLGGIFWNLINTRISVSGRLENKSVSARVESLRDAQALFGLHPLVGVGIGNSAAAVSSEVDRLRDGYAIEPAHSAPVAVLVELGLFGFGLFIVLLYYCFEGAVKNKQLGIGVALLVLALGDHWAWTTLAGILLFWAVWAMALHDEEIPLT